MEEHEGKMKKTIFVLASGTLVLLAGCRPRIFNETQAPIVNSTPQTPFVFPDFCSASDANTDIWNAPRVQKEISHLIEEKNFKSSGLSTYAEAYLAMTQARDKARCAPQDPMYPKSPLARRLNDALADIMTKGFVDGQRACLQFLLGERVVVPETGKQLCAANQQALNERWSALEFAMASTGIYLTSVMGLALSALPHVDALWAETPHTTLDTRLKAMEEFRSTYDAFNLFLSNNLHTVAQVLLKEKRVNCEIFAVAARSIELTRAPTLLFQEIRNDTFKLGLQLAKQWPRGLHPFTAGLKTWETKKEFGAFAKEPDALISLRAHSQKAVGQLKNPLLKIFNGNDIATYISFEGLTCPVHE